MTAPRALVLALVLAASAPLFGGESSRLAAQHDCSYCHDVHGGFTSTSTALNREAVVEDICTTCHSDAGPGYLVGADPVTDTVRSNLTLVTVHVGAKHAVGDTTSCWDCHDHQGEAGSNLAMIPQTLDLPGGGTATVVFTSNTSPSDFIGTAGICYVCHTDAGTQSTGLNGHNGPDACNVCHSHDVGFQGTGGCTLCHDVARGNHRPVVSEFDRASHHVQRGGAGADIPAPDCKVCHDQTGHPRTGTDHVVLINQDDLSTINYEAGVTATSVLTPFCLSCHDADGGQGGDTSPFSDNVLRPEIDEALWTISSHAANAACADCHEAHGSEKRRLLTPGNVVPNATTRYEEEEGFCYGCHDGTPASDVLASFTGAIRHPVSDPEQPTGRAVECLNCHDPHVADGSSHTYSSTANSARNNVSGAIKGVPGVDFNSSGLLNFQAPALIDYSSVDPATKEYQLCLGCHSGYSWLPGSPPTGLSPNGSVSNPVMTDVAQEFNPQNRSGHPIVTGLDNYANSILVSGSKGLQANVMKAPWDSNLGSQTMMCSDCHNTDQSAPAAQGPHGSAVSFMLRGPNVTWPPTVDMKTQSLDVQYNASFCGNCHQYDRNNVAHDEHDTRRDIYCYTCHIVVPHGGKMSRLITDHDAMPARYAYSNTLNTNFVQAFTKRVQDQYSRSDCRAQCSSKHRNRTPSENWN